MKDTHSSETTPEAVKKSHEYQKIMVLDTNIILEDAHNLTKISQNGENLIVLPETVIDEADSKKSGFNEINFQAREFGRILADAEVIGTKTCDYMFTEVTVMSIKVKNMFIDIISLEKYNLDDVDKSVLNDRKIIKVAQFCTEHYNKETTLLSSDIMCRTRAISLNVITSGLNKTIESLDNQFFKELDVCSSSFNIMDDKFIDDFDFKYKPENYCYQFKAQDGNTRLGYIVDSRIKLINDNLFNALPIKPINRGQRFAIAGMLDPEIDICISDALSGSGKTLLAISAGMQLVKQGKFGKIIYIRNSIESADKGEDIGYLPGSESEKLLGFNWPLYDTLDFISNKVKKREKETQECKDKNVQDLIKKYHIETMATGSIRGRTLSNAYVIIDEVQNFSKKSLQTVLTRLGKDSKAVVIGSNRQIDNPYINKYTNGLSVLLKSAKEEPEVINIFGCTLDKVVRGPITEYIESIFER